MSQSIRANQKRQKMREHEEDIPIEGARLIVKNLDFSVGNEDLEELFRKVNYQHSKLDWAEITVVKRV